MHALLMHGPAKALPWSSPTVTHQTQASTQALGTALAQAVQAVKAYRGAVQADEGHSAAALALVKLHLEGGEQEAGCAACAQLLASQPHNLEARLLMVHLLCAKVCSDCLTSTGSVTEQHAPMLALSTVTAG